MTTQARSARFERMARERDQLHELSANLREALREITVILDHTNGTPGWKATMAARDRARSAYLASLGNRS